MVDWERAHHRLADMQARLDVSWSPDPQAQRATLRERARRLARDVSNQPARKDRIAVLVFGLGEERYAFEAAYVREVASAAGLTPVPCTPAFVAGIINMRGQILSVVDLGNLLELPESQAVERSQVIVLSTDAMDVGVLATTIFGLDAIAEDELSPPLPTVAGRRAQYVKGVSQSQVAILDAPKMFSADLIVHAEAQP